MREILISNESKTVHNGAVIQAVGAVQRQVHEHFAPAYVGLDATLTFVIGKPPAGRECIHILDDSDQANAEGYHELDKKDVPEGFVFARTSQQDGDPWQVTLSHEVLEQIADPNMQLLAVGPLNGRISGIAYECADPTESDTYLIDGVPVSNFVLPSWYLGHAGKVDYLGKLKKGLTMTPGGYIAYTTDLRHWKDVFGTHVKPRHLVKHKHGRRARRAEKQSLALAGQVDLTSILDGLRQILVHAPTILDGIDRLTSLLVGRKPA